MWTESDLNDKTINDFEQFGSIYIGGGNTFKLLKELKEFGTFEILRELAQKNIPIYGRSAGAIIFAKTIIPALSIDENLVGLTDFTALNLINNYEIWCHYDESMNLIIKSYMKKFDLKKIITIPENAGLYINENDIEVVGPADIKVFEAEDIKIFKSRSLIKQVTL